MFDSGLNAAATFPLASPRTSARIALALHAGRRAGRRRRGRRARCPSPAPARRCTRRSGRSAPAPPPTTQRTSHDNWAASAARRPRRRLRSGAAFARARQPRDQPRARGPATEARRRTCAYSACAGSSGGQLGRDVEILGADIVGRRDQAAALEIAVRVPGARIFGDELLEARDRVQVRALDVDVERAGAGIFVARRSSRRWARRP